MKLTDSQIIEYLHRSYTAVDGLWFMKIEEKYGFDVALDIDEKVWQIQAKIQARKLKKLTDLNSGLDALYKCFTTKLNLDKCRFTAQNKFDKKSFTVAITHCHWLELLRKSDREILAEKIGSRICKAEYSAWAAEFGSDIRLEIQSQICKGDDHCILKFSSKEIEGQQ